ncbi:MAG: hypothetical protein ABI671_21055 [Burkholderiales bacterium]
MKRLLALALCALGIVYAITGCGGGGDDGTAAEDKLTIVGAGS